MKAFVAASVFDKVLTAISRYNMLGPGDRVIAAVSGGADSVFLLLALKEIAPRTGATLAGVAHLNHKLRGEASDADETFVEKLAAECGVLFFRDTARVSEAPGNLEQAARRARLEFFAKLIRGGKADRIATGHTRDDQAETVLFRMLRGSGLAGLAGILPVTREGLIRPLLETPRAEIEAFLRQRGIAWQEDATNRESRFARNRIRHGLLPRLEREWNPELRASLARMAELAGEEERWWNARIRKLAQKTVVARSGGIEIAAEVLTRLSRAVSRRLVRELIRRVGRRSAEFEHVERILDLAGSPRGSGLLELPGLIVTRSFGWLRFMPRFAAAPATEAPLAVPIQAGSGFCGRYPWDGSVLCLEVIGGVGGLRQSGPPGCARLKGKGQAIAHLELRAWKDGDHYRPWGRPRDQKLKEMFQKARIPSWKRGFWPIVTNGSKILWAREFGPAADTGRGSGAGRGRGAGREWELWLRVWEEPFAGFPESATRPA